MRMEGMFEAFLFSLQEGIKIKPSWKEGFPLYGFLFSGLHLIMQRDLVVAECRIRAQRNQISK